MNHKACRGAALIQKDRLPVKENNSLTENEQTLNEDVDHHMTLDEQTEPDTCEHRRELRRLHNVEFEDKTEIFIRMFGTLGGAFIIWGYTGWISTWLWVSLYFALEAGYFWFLTSRMKNASRSDVLIAHIVFVLILASYVWIPIRMMASGDDALSVSGFCILGGVLVFLVRRSETSLFLTLAEVGVMSVAISIGVVTVILRQDDWLGIVGLFFAVVMLTFYLVQNAYLVRRQRLRADEVAERTLQAQKMEAIGKLAGGVAHDFNNILTAVIGNLDLVEEVDDPELKREFLANARESAMHGAEVVAQLLVYARKSDMQPKFVMASQLLKTVKNMSRALVPPPISIDMELLVQDRGVRLDQALFVAAMLNLIKNGADAVEGSGQINIYAVARHLDRPFGCAGGGTLPAGDYVVFGVTDTGTGIPDNVLPRVTDPFFTTKAVGKGSGMGLSMVVGFAQKSGGGLSISTSEEGTTVEILLAEAVETDPVVDRENAPTAIVQEPTQIGPKVSDPTVIL